MARPKLALRLLAAVVLALPLIPLSSGAAIAAATRASIVMGDDGLQPSSVSIGTGGTVTWINDTDYTITLASSNGTWPSQRVSPDGSWSYTFPAAGTYTFTTTSTSEGGRTITRTGTVTVSGPGPAPSPSPSPSPSPTPPPPPPPPSPTPPPPPPPTPSPTPPPPPPPTPSPTPPPPPPPTPSPTPPPPPPPTPSPTPPPPPPPTPSPTATPAPPPPSNTTVTIGDDFFNPKTVTVALGSTVTWMDSGSNHTVTCTGSCGPQSFDSGNINNGQSFSHMFTVAGTYNYICVYHAPGMAGTITVQ